MRHEPPKPIDDRQAAGLYQTLYDSPLLGLIVVQRLRIVLGNVMLERLSGYRLAELYHFSPRELLRLIHPKDRSHLLRQYRERLAGQHPKRAYHVRLRHRTQGFRWLRVLATPARLQGEPAAQAVLLDVTETEAARRRLQYNKQTLEQIRSGLEQSVRERTAQLRDTTTYLATLFEHSHDGIGVVDDQGRFEHGNPASFRIVGWPREELIGQYFLKIFPPEQHAFMLARWVEVQRGEGRPYETEILAKNGDRRHLLISHSHMSIGGQRKYVVVLADITRQKREQEQLRVYGERLEQMVAARTAELTTANARLQRSEAALERAQAIAHVGSFAWYPDSGRVLWTPEMFRLYGVDPADGIPAKTELDRRCHPDDWPRVDQHIRQTLRTGKPMAFVFRLCHDDGNIRYVQVRGRRRQAEPPERGHVFEGTMMDVTEQRQMEQVIIATSQREQRRIGIDIHESLSQDLSALSMLATALETGLRQAGSAVLADQAANLAALTRLTVSKSTSLAYSLTPIDIQVGGLKTELRRMAEKLGSLHQVPIRFDADIRRELDDVGMATHLYYIAKEAVVCAIHQTGATEIAIRLRLHRRSGLLAIRDNGTWPPDNADAAVDASRRVMQHRADLVNAMLACQRPRAGGQTLTCRFDMPKIS